MTHTLQPLPALTAEQALAERTAANLEEANRIVRDLDLSAALFDHGKLAVKIAVALQAAEDRGDQPRVIPDLLAVFGSAADGDLGPLDEAMLAVARAEGWQLVEGLQCPHCGAVTWDGDDSGIYVIDRSLRWSRFGFEVDPDAPVYGPERRTADGWLPREVIGHAPRHMVVGGYGDGEHHGVGYACETCDRRVGLPVDVEEVGD